MFRIQAVLQHAASRRHETRRAALRPESETGPNRKRARIGNGVGSHRGGIHGRVLRYRDGVATSLVYEFRAPLWPWQSRRDLWTFVTLPEDAADEIAAATDTMARGFGAVRVEARIGSVTWRTSIFPQSTGGSYVLPVKRAVRDANHLEVGDEVAVRLQVLR
jgi:hypothetical protein